MNVDVGWLLFAYVTGSVATGYMVWKAVAYKAAEVTIDTLIENGFLRYKRSQDGDIEILKWNQVED